MHKFKIGDKVQVLQNKDHVPADLQGAKGAISHLMEEPESKRQGFEGPAYLVDIEGPAGRVVVDEAWLDPA